ncbi:MAG: glutamate racemase [Candidatus Omnitrophica bacterium]|nr:glutamate racemase [Candidatus Omnitrophota bacterium]
MRKGRDKDCAIGVFDSGLGGLTVVKELMRQLPSEDIIYYGDTARVPYGTKSKESIIRFSIENTKVLLKHKVKMVVVACNSSSSYALDTLRRNFRVPVVGVIHPGAKKAIDLTKNKRVGVIATSATVASHEYVRTIKGYDKGVKVFAKACPLFVPLAEEGWFRKPVTVDIAKEYLAPLRSKNIDVLILGCTHYPFLKGALKKAVGGKVELIDSAKEVASAVRALLTASENGKVSTRKPRHKFLISDRPQEFKRIAKNFLGRDIKHITKV